MNTKILLEGWWWYGNRQNKAHKVFTEGYRPSWCPVGMTATICGAAYWMLASAPETQPRCKRCLRLQHRYMAHDEVPL